ncbi:hypothetical protein VUR80DRAFT_5798 [Thermomyces stellatus]
MKGWRLAPSLRSFSAHTTAAPCDEQAPATPSHHHHITTTFLAIAIVPGKPITPITKMGLVTRDETGTVGQGKEEPPNGRTPLLLFSAGRTSRRAPISRPRQRLPAQSKRGLYPVLQRALHRPADAAWPGVLEGWVSRKDVLVAHGVRRGPVKRRQG